MLKGDKLTIRIEDSQGNLYIGVASKQDSLKSKHSKLGHKPQHKGRKGTVTRVSRKISVKDAINRIIASGLLKEWRTVEAVHLQLKIKVYTYEIDAVRMCLIRMARANDLQRELFKEGNNNVYKYKAA